MSDRNKWATFEKTGDIRDYLSYKGIMFHDEAPENYVGEQTFESKNNSDRNGNIRHTHRGI